MINPDQQEKHLAPMDVKIKNKLNTATVVVALIIVIGVMVAAELIMRAIAFLRSW